jgi:protein ImuA
MPFMHRGAHPPVACERAARAERSPALDRVDQPLAGLHPALWRAGQVARVAGGVCGSGWAALDAELPGGGWPCRTLTELLLPQAGVGELRLLVPALVAAAGQQGLGRRPLMWFDPPADPCPWALGALGLAPEQLVVLKGGGVGGGGGRVGASLAGAPQLFVRRDGARGRARERLPAADVLWALEQTLASGQAAAVLAWLPAQLPADALRRLQLAAAGHPGPAFLLREPAARRLASPAAVRLLLRPGPAPDTVRLQILKRRGPPPAGPLDLALPPVLSEAARQRAVAGRAGAGGVGAGRGVGVGVEAAAAIVPRISAGADAEAEADAGVAVR